MRCLVILTLYSLFCLKGYTQENYVLYSPDSTLKIKISTDKVLNYSLFANEKLLTSSPSIDININNEQHLSDKLAVKKSPYKKIREAIEVAVSYRQNKINNRYNQLTIQFRQPFSIEFRLFNNGMAYRIGTRFKDSVYIINEKVDFQFENPQDIWYAHIYKLADKDQFHTSFEGQYRKVSFQNFSDTGITYAPLVVSLSNGYHLGITDANLYDYPGMFLKRNEEKISGVFAPYPLKEEMTGGEFPQLIVTERAGFIAKTKGTRMLPWRAILVAKQSIELPVNDIVYLLADPSNIKDASWVKTGKGTDEWINGISLFNVPFVAGINTETYKFYIDFAKKFGFDQVMLDAGWSNYKDLFDINPNINMDTLSAYAKKNNV